MDGRIVPTEFSTYSLDKMKWYPVVEVNVPEHIVSPQMCEANKIHHTLQPVSIRKLSEGAWLVDMGRIQTGWFEMQMPVLPVGHEVTMEYSDNLTKEGVMFIFPVDGGESILGISSIIMLIVMSVSPTFR